MTFIAYQNIELDGVQVEQASFIADTRETFQPPMYGLRSDYEDLFAYEAALAELTAQQKAAEAALDKAAIATAESEQFEKEAELAALENEKVKDKAKIAKLQAEIAAIEDKLVKLRAPVTEIEAKLAALVKPAKVFPFVLIDRIEEHEGRAKIVNGKVLFDTDIDVAEMKALEEQYTAQVQEMLDKAAQELGYDSCLSVCSYIETGVAKFDAEGRQFRAWRSAIWNRGYELLDEVKAGTRPVPAPEELPGLLPKLEEFADAS